MGPTAAAWWRIVAAALHAILYRNFVIATL
jgi:hypothetical protein